MNSKWYCIGFPIVFIISFFSVYFFSGSEFIMGMYATPGVLALLGILYQIFRDRNSHIKNIELQKQQQFFNIGAASHMANVVFDKHVEFCEQYMKEVHIIVSIFFKDGPTEKVLDNAAKLGEWRNDYAAWITEDINEKLIPFEQALRELGSGFKYANSVRENIDEEEQRKEAIKRVFDRFRNILSLDENAPIDPDIAIESIKKKIRQILNIDDLLILRRTIISESMKSLEK